MKTVLAGLAPQGRPEHAETVLVAPPPAAAWLALGDQPPPRGGLRPLPQAVHHRRRMVAERGADPGARAEPELVVEQPRRQQVTLLQ